MKKVIFIALFALEVLLGFLSIGLLLSSIGAFSYLVAAVLYAAGLTPFFIKLKKTEDQEKKKKIRRNILLLSLIPTVIAFIVVAVVVISLIVFFI